MTNHADASPGRTILSGGRIVLADRVLEIGSVIVDGDRITEVVARAVARDAGSRFVDCTGRIVVPGFIDVHVHGVEGRDALEAGDAIDAMARTLPRYGVTAFCPTSIACEPAALDTMLAALRQARELTAAGARVLPAHLESNFINPKYCGAQPVECLRAPRAAPVEGEFAAREILDTIYKRAGDIAIVTAAPELDGGIDLVRDLVTRGIRVSLGHSGATYEEAMAGVDAGATHATHLFNRMTPLNHRSPGLAAAVLDREEVTAEIIPDGVHVHPAMMRVAYAAKRSRGLMAITDGTAGSGLPTGSRTNIGGRPITVRDAAYLDDGTLAGSVLTMDRALIKLVETGIPLAEAARMCATSPADALGLGSQGRIAAGALADLAVLDENLRVIATFVAGRAAWEAQG